MQTLTHIAGATRYGKLSVVIVTYNSAEVLPGLLDSLAEGLAGIEDTEIVVVDNDSHDASIRIAAMHPIGVKVIPTGRNAGYAAGINVATRFIAPDRHLLVLNPDIRLHKGSVAVLLRRLSSPSVGVVAPQIFNEDGTVARSLRREPSLLTAWSDALLGGTLSTRMGIGEIVGEESVYETGGSVDWATGAYLLISAAARRAVGDWDESYFLYSEEVDYLRRVRDQGLSVLYVPSATATHIGGEHKVVPRLYALLTANRIRYYRHYHGAIPAALFQFGVAIGEVMRSARSEVHRAGLRAVIAAPLPPG